MQVRMDTFFIMLSLILPPNSSFCYFYRRYNAIQSDSIGMLTVCLVIGTGLLGWLLNIVLVLCSGPL